jgi:methyl-accepting chemotaxis protein WspA
VRRWSDEAQHQVEITQSFFMGIYTVTRGQFRAFADADGYITEAEKAGEHGRGFAVVATEIRRLADQTAVASYDIEQLVKEMQSAVSAGVMGMDKFSEEVRRGVDEVRQVSTHLAQIIHQVQTLTPTFQTVNEGMHAQATGAQQISETLTQLSEAAQQTAESLRQSNVSIEQLNGAARGLQTSVARFKLVTGSEAPRLN